MKSWVADEMCARTGSAPDNTYQQLQPHRHSRWLAMDEPYLADRTPSINEDPIWRPAAHARNSQL